MASFQVVAEELSAAGALVAASDTELTAGRSSVKGSVDALTGTPASVNYALLVANVDTVVTGAQTAVTSLGEALREAAAAYALADDSAARSLTVKKGH
jgi:malonyl CoA-acyl carrier protein transacylase